MSRLLFFSIFLLSTISYGSSELLVPEIQTIQEVPLTCVESLGATPIDRMFHQVEAIAYKNEISVPWFSRAIRRWKAGQKDFSLGLLLRIAILFHVDTS